jgi:hypothetical protein
MEEVDMQRKERLIKDIQDLINNHGAVQETTINPTLLEFMDEETLLSIINSLLDQKEDSQKIDTQWLEKFKTQE